MGIFDNGLSYVSQWGSNLKVVRPPLEKYYGFFIAALIGWMVADLLLLSYRPSMLPSEAPPVQQDRQRVQKIAALQDYNSIVDRNIFSEDGKIPPALSADKNGTGDQSAPVQSSLPIQLLGTIVHFNPKMSIATVTLNSSNTTQSYSVDEVMGDIAELKKIERKRIVFMNTNLRRLEYIEIPEDAAFNFDVKAPNLNAGNDLVQKEGNFDYSIKRSDLENLTGNLSSLLQQARMEPRMGPDGQPDGFCFTNIQPGTPYEKFGFKIGDCIKNVNGEAINSPGKAMELYQLLRQASFVQLGIERDGRDEKFNYSIK